MRKYLLIVTAVSEGGTGLLLLLAPAVVLGLLLGVERSAPEALMTARIFGVALLAIAATCWLARDDPGAWPCAAFWPVF